MPSWTIDGLGVFFDDYTAGASDQGFSNTNEFYMRTQLADSGIGVIGMLFNTFKHRYRENPKKLIGIIRDGRMTKTADNLSGQIDSHAAPDDHGVTQEHINQVVQDNVGMDTEDAFP